MFPQLGYAGKSRYIKKPNAFLMQKLVKGVGLTGEFYASKL